MIERIHFHRFLLQENEFPQGAAAFETVDNVVRESFQRIQIECPVADDVLCLLGKVRENCPPVGVFSLFHQNGEPYQYLPQFLNAPFLDFLDHPSMMADIVRKIENKFERHDISHIAIPSLLNIEYLWYTIKDRSDFKKMKYHIGLGSNIGERKKNLERAVALLEENGIRVIQKSSVYETSPVGVLEQSWFLNQVIEVQTDRDPQTLLRIAKGIEKRMGRTPAVAKGPRCIDIDILLAENKIVRTGSLCIPHPELANRNFVLLPLKEIAHDTVHPVFKTTIGDLWQKSKDSSIVRFYMPA